MNCPVCNVQLLMTERQKTQVDYCPQCRGIWLEKGNLDKIIERSFAEIPLKAVSQGYDAQPVQRYDEHHDKHYDNHNGGYRKKRGFLQDLFD
jgi:Zn-finger nucleic acid-binding protein